MAAREEYQVPEAGNDAGFKASTKYYALALFTGAYALNHVDRQIIGVLIEPIRNEFGLTDSQIGLLVGIFIVPYIIAAMPIGYLADRSNRRNLLSACLLVWSGFTAACGLAKTYTQLLFFRALVGAGEAGCNPTAMPLISDYFPPEKRSSALGVYGIGTSIGSLVAFSIGGWVGGTFGWRYALFLVAIPGVILSLLIFLTLKEPKRGASDHGSEKSKISPSFFFTAKLMWSYRNVRFHLIAMICFVMAYASILTWLTPFFSRSHGLELKEIGLILGLIIGIVGGAGSLIGGYFADRFARKGLQYIPIFLGLTYFACAPFAWLGFSVSASTAALVCFAGWAFCAGLGTGPQFALLQNMVGVRSRGTAVAILSVLLNLFAFYGGPQLVGIVSDFWGAKVGEESLRYSLSSIAWLYILATAFCLLTSIALKNKAYTWPTNS